jgi:molybdate transport system substrate-binding protein
VTEIKVLSAGAVEGLLAAVVPEFTRQSGIRVSKSFGTVGLVQKRLKAGEQADVIIMSSAAIDGLEQEGGALPGSRRDVCRTTVGVAVREGTPLPDISTPKAFKHTLLTARSITATDPAAGGSAGIYLVQ